jgi:hypothetical protein
MTPEGPQKVHVETSVWGMTLDNQPRALRQPTKQFLKQCARSLFLPYISTVVMDEIDLAPAKAAARMRRLIDNMAPSLLELTDESEQLAQKYLQAGIIPAKKLADARHVAHVAIATVSEMDIVVSWNHRHLANERKRSLFNEINRLAGHKELEIHTPFEVLT